LITRYRPQRVDRHRLAGEILEFLQALAESDVGNDELGALVVARAAIALIVPLPAKSKATGVNPVSARSVAPDASASATMRSFS